MNSYKNLAVLFSQCRFLRKPRPIYTTCWLLLLGFYIIPSYHMNITANHWKAWIYIGYSFLCVYKFSPLIANQRVYALRIKIIIRLKSWNNANFCVFERYFNDLLLLPAVKIFNFKVSFFEYQIFCLFVVSGLYLRYTLFRFLEFICIGLYYEKYIIIDI